MKKSKKIKLLEDKVALLEETIKSMTQQSSYTTNPSMPVNVATRTKMIDINAEGREKF